MGFRDEVLAGMVQEFQVYKNQIYKAFLIFGIAVCKSAFSGFALFSASKERNLYILTNVFFHVVFTPTALMMIAEMSANQDAKLQNFMRVNGMSKLAYSAKSLFANYFIVLFVCFLNSIGSSLSMIGAGGTFVNVLEIFMINILAAVALVNLCYLIARFVDEKFVLYVAVLWFLGFPIIAGTIPDVQNYIAILNPFVAMDVREANIDTEWLRAFLILLGACIVYTGIFAFTEWYTGEYTKKRQGKRDPKQDKLREMSLPLMELGDDDDLLVGDIESSVISSGVSSARYEEPISAENTKKTIIRVRELGKIYKNATEPALDNVTLQILEGEVFCLLGYNGAGKTTLLNILCGLIPKTEGSVHYENKLKESDGVSQVLGFCSQENLALTENTVYENFMLMAKIRGVKKEQAKTIIQYLIQQFQLNQLEHMVVSKLKVEERKRLSLALALLNNPKIIIMDEPTSGLDVVARKDVWKKIQVLKQSGKTVVFTTQFLDDAEALADRVAILANGGLFAIGSVDYVKKSFGTGYTLVISNSVNPGQLTNQAPQITDIVNKILPQAELTSDTTLNILKYALSFSDRNKFSRLLRELEEIPDIQINLQRSSLEDAFKGLERNFKIKGRRKDETSHNSNSIEDMFAKNYQSRIISQTRAIILRRFYKFKSEKKKNIVFLTFFTLLGIALKLILDKYPLGDRLIWKDMTNPIVKITFQEISNITKRPIIIYQVIMLFYITLFSAREMMVARIKDLIVAMRVMGLKDFPYYFGNLIADFIFLLPLTITLGVELIFYEFPEDHLALNFARILIVPFCIIVFGYCCSFNAHKDAYLILFMIILATFSYFVKVMLMIPDVMPNEKGGPPLEELGIVLSFTLLLMGLFFPGPLIKDYLHVLVFSYLLHFLSLHYREYWMRNLHQYRSKFTSPPPPRPDLNNFITQERARLNAENNQDIVKVLGGEKYYPNNNKILWNLNFGVEKGQIFCLLGPNQSGKSLIFDILNRRTFLDCGNIFINGKEISKKHAPTTTTGACLQTDSHWSTLTVRQNLKVVAIIRGMSNQESDEAVEQIMHALDLHKHSAKQARHLSAGTQRKLNVAMALLGGPELVLLDTPTTGVDPVGRNQIWTLLKKLVKVKNSTILLSTHYTEDAELVADKLGIVVNGTIATIGTISALRKSYIVHYIVIDEVAEGFTDMLTGIVKGIIPEATVISHSNKKGMRFRVPSTAMKFCQIVEELENLNTDKKITDFSINVKTLEQTFMAYACQQVKPILASDAAHQQTLYGKPMQG